MRSRLWAELVLIFLGIPALLALLHAQRPVMYMSMWILSAYGIMAMRSRPPFSWKEIWHGRGWSKAAQKTALLRFLVATFMIGIFLAWRYPEELLSFPRHQPKMWLFVMLAYPVLSVLPQEFIFRSFFFHRYSRLFAQPWLLFALNCFCFAYLHIVFHNWVAPLLSGVGGLVFTYSYQQHGSLKWVLIEHIAYGCMIFTIGLGWFFFHGVR